MRIETGPASNDSMPVLHIVGCAGSSSLVIYNMQNEASRPDGLVTKHLDRLPQEKVRDQFGL